MTNPSCSRCKKRNVCTELCLKAEEFAGQDYIYQREKTIGIPVYSDKEWPDPTNKSPFTPTEKKILSRLVSGESREQISKSLNISRDSLKHHLQRLKEKRDKNLHFKDK